MTLIVTLIGPFLLEAAMLNLRGQYCLQHFRRGQLIETEVFGNLITNEGREFILDSNFNGELQTINWHLGLISVFGFTILSPSDIYTGINTTNGWGEEDNYSDPTTDTFLTRPPWQPEDAADNKVMSISPALFDFHDSVTIKGAFLCGGADAENKITANSGNVLFSEALFANGNRAFLVDDQLRLAYTVQV